MKINNFVSLKLKILFSILFVFVLCGFIVIAQDQEIILDTSSDVISQPDAGDTEIVSQVSDNDEIYVNLDDLVEEISEPVIEKNIIMPETVQEQEYNGNSTEQENNIVSNEDELFVNETIENSSYIDSDLNESTEIVETQSTAESSASSTESENYDYIDLDEIVENMESNDENVVDINEEEKKEITYTLYQGNKKEVETSAIKGGNLVIEVESFVFQGDDWKKEVTVYSNEHHENPVTLYSDVKEDEEVEINVFWKEEKANLDHSSFDLNNNGIIDRISWVVPHLSEQNFLITLEETNTTNSTGQIIISSPIFNQNITYSTVVLNFSINSSDGIVPLCEFSLLKSGNLVNNSVFTAPSITYNISVENGFYTWNMSCADSGNSVYNSSIGNFTVNIPQTNFVTIYSNVNQVLKNSVLNVSININSSVNQIVYSLNWGDGSSTNNISVNSFSVNSVLPHTYTSNGNYAITLTTVLSGTLYERKHNITVYSTGATIDNTDPKVELIYPENGQDLTGSAVNFTYQVSDEVKLSNCTLNVYYYQNNSLLGVSVYSKTDKNIVNGNISNYVSGLSRGDYSWDVGCYDNSSNYEETNYDFQLESSQYYANYAESTPVLASGDQKIVDDINVLVDGINGFLDKFDSYGVKEREVIEDLGLDVKINTYKKVLIQNKLDITYNLGFVRDEKLRQERKDEISSKVAEMSSEIPRDIQVIDSYEYYKTESHSDIKQIISEMLNLNALSTNDNTLNAMAESIQELQTNSVISNNVKQVKIDYGGFVDEITLVRKTVEIQNSSFDFFVERVPSDVSTSRIVSVTKSKSLGNQIFEIQSADLNNWEIIYYIKDKVDLKSFEKTNLVLFDEDVLSMKQLSGITGFVSYFGYDDIQVIWPYTAGFIFVFGLLFGGAYYARQAKYYRVAGQNQEFKIVESKLKSANKFIELKDFESAKSEYRAIKSSYGLLPEEAKKLAYVQISKLQVEIDRKEAIELVKEFISTVQGGRKDEAKLLYNKIKSVYPRLPEQDRQKGYDKIAPYLNLLNSK